MSFIELAEHLGTTAKCPVAYATGSAGDVYLCHPFLVHAAQAHHGRTPRFMAQPPLRLLRELEIDRPGHVYSRVEEAIRLGLGFG